MASRYSRYESDRRSRSPRDRSPDRFDRNSQYGDGDRRRPSAVEARNNASAFQPNRDGFGDGPRREPPRGPRALIDAPSGPRGGFHGDFRGRGRGRGRGWASRDESRDRGRDRDIDFRDRYRDDRSRERDRDRDWRDSRDFRSRRSPIGRARSPTRDFRDRDRDGPPGPDADRSRRGSRDGPLTGGSPPHEPPFGMTGPPRGGGFLRGRGRGGRGDWQSDRGRGRAPFDDRGDRYIRSRSQEGRWARDRDERDRGDRYLDGEMRRDPREDRDRGGDRELFRAKMDARAASAQEVPQPSKEISPPPVAPSAPAFGSVPSRNPSLGDGIPGTGKPPPTGPRAYTDRTPSIGHAGSQEAPDMSTGASKHFNHENPQIPLGPRAQQQKSQRPSSRQWINPNIKKMPESPKMSRVQSFAQQRSDLTARDGSHIDQPWQDSRPRSSDSKSGHGPTSSEHRRRIHHSAEPGEIMQTPEFDSRPSEESVDKPPSHDYHAESSWRDRSHYSDQRQQYTPALKAYSAEAAPEPVAAQAKGAEISKDPPRDEPTRKRKRRIPVRAVRFAVPPKTQAPSVDQDSESDDDEDMGDYFAMEIEKTEAELAKLQKPELPLEVVARFAAMSHGSMVKILNESDRLFEMFGDIRPQALIPEAPVKALSPVLEKIAEAQEVEPSPVDVEMVDGTVVAETEPKPLSPDLQPKNEEMELATATAEVPRMPVIEELPFVEAVVEEQSVEAASPPSAIEGPVDEVAQLHDNISQLDDTERTEIAEDRSKPPSTPSQVEDEGEETESDYEAIIDVESVRHYMVTPPIDSLPNFDVLPWSQDQDLLTSFDPKDDLDDMILESLSKIHLDKTAEQHRDQQIYKAAYSQYLDFTASNDPIAVKIRDKFTVVVPQVDAVVTTMAPEAKPEGRGTGRRFASERDLERVLQASMREDEERREREVRAQKEKYRTDKEAEIPDMLWDAEERQNVAYVDRSGYVPHDRLVSAWQVLPPHNNFTEEEAQLFEKRYLELPKQWGKVAEVIPNRNFGECIQYYYLMKRELNLKEKLKKQPKRRKKGGRGKQRSSALVSELGNGDGDGEDNNENGENGENRRRPRRAAAPTWGFEQPPTETESSTPAGTPGRRIGSSAGSKGEQPEKIDGRKGRRKAAKDKDSKSSKPQALAAAPGPGPGRARARSDAKGQTFEFQPSLTAEPHRLPTHFEQPHSGMQPPFSVIPQPQQVPHQQPLPNLDRSQTLPPTSVVDVMAPPSLRPEPPMPNPQPAMTTFNMSQPQSERKAPTSASSYWSVAESNDFPHLLKAFGSDWNAIAAHMGSKTATMVKNYYVRQKDHGKAEWEAFVHEADAKRSRGEKRPDPPQPTTASGRGRRYDTAVGGPSRPLAVAPGDINGPPEPVQAKVEPNQQARAQPFSGYGGVPIAQAPMQQQSLAQTGQQSRPVQRGQQPVSQPVSQSMSPGVRPLRAPLQPFGFPEREREPSQQRMPLPQKAPTDMREQRLMGPGQPSQALQSDPLMERHKLEIQQHQMREMDRERERERDREREREREAKMMRHAERERHSMRPKQEADMPPQHHFDPYGHRHTGPPSQRADSLLLSRPPPDGPRHSSHPSYPPPMQSSGPGPLRGLLSDAPLVQSPPLGPPISRPISSMQQRQPGSSAHDFYAQPIPQSSTPAPAPAAAPRPPEPRKTSNIMSLLNDDPPPPPKRVNDMTAPSSNASSTPPPQSGRPPPGPASGSQLRREEPQYSPYGRAPSGGGPGMPPLKPPTYNNSPTTQQPGGPRSGMGPGVDSPASERDYFRGHHYQQSHPASGTNSPQATQRYPPPGQSGQMYQSPSGYPTSYGGASQPPHAASPPPQYPMQGSHSRSREASLSGREQWPPAGHQPPASSWQSQHGKPGQAPPPQQTWPPQHGPGTPKAGTPTGNWSSGPAPPQQSHHPGMREERGPPPMFATHQQQRYGPPPSSRGPDTVPPPSQAYPRYASTSGPGPGPPRDPRDIPGRSFTPSAYDNRGPPPPSHAYPGADLRDMQLRDSRDSRDPRDPRDPRDHRDMRGLRPHEYDRHPDHYGR